MLGRNKGKRIEKYIEDYVVFDLETTGVSCYNDQVVEISAVKVKNLLPWLIRDVRFLMGQAR